MEDSKRPRNWKIEEEKFIENIQLQKKRFLKAFPLKMTLIYSFHNL